MAHCGVSTSISSPNAVRNAASLSSAPDYWLQRCSKCAYAPRSLSLLEEHRCEDSRLKYLQLVSDPACLRAFSAHISFCHGAVSSSGELFPCTPLCDCLSLHTHNLAEASWTLPTGTCSLLVRSICHTDCPQSDHSHPFHPVVPREQMRASEVLEFGASGRHYTGSNSGSVSSAYHSHSSIEPRKVSRTLEHDITRRSDSSSSPSPSYRSDSESS